MKEQARYALAADHVFDGTALHEDCAVLIDGGDIVQLVRRGEIPEKISAHELPSGAWLAPGFIDVQVNGGGDVLFNDEPTSAGIAAIAAAHRRFGTTGLLPTLISDTPEKMRAARDAVATAMRTNPSILGIHFEGPFLSADRPGAHDPGMLRRPEAREREWLTQWRDGVMLVTLAPEIVPEGFIAGLVDAGIKVSLGHSMATYQQTRVALAEGLTGFTHLFNAMRPLASREPGPIAAALESDNCWFGMIVDGVHVDPAMLRLALRGRARPMLVTDAMPPVGGKRDTFMLGGRAVLANAGGCIRDDGTLAGSALDMAKAVRNSVKLLGMPLTGALRAATAEPARFLGLAHRLGHLAPGCRADMVALDASEITVLQTWVAGRVSSAPVTPCTSRR
ncbi:MAG: N-acetylglucosamine-6-phosphate deacetylase [Bradyrhizobiaceae bacterium]|nr:N-acetylglucosamine-6-phosphate deacetylase [Bradyrhizobiaceae bacterium]